MQVTPAEMSVKEIIDLRKEDMIKPNPEYQRGVVWTLDQQKKLIDSVLRGYRLPIIYLHKIDKKVAGMIRQGYDIIDGQQRIVALHRFVEGTFPLYDVKDERAKLPLFLRDQPCPWSGKHMHELTEEDRERLLQTRLPISCIHTDNDNEVRDLFVRLQAGFPLNHQEKRDSYPGLFGEYILWLGGKPDIIKYQGHRFFQDVLRMRPGSDRGKTRQLAAQITILFLERYVRDVEYFSDINAKAIDEYYYKHLDFDEATDRNKRLLVILDKLTELMAFDKGPKLRAHEAIHLILFVDTIWDDYTRFWESQIAEAVRAFSAELNEANATRYDPKPHETWLQYGVHTRANSDRGDSIQRRHNFYCQRMAEYIENLTPKDERRFFTSTEREQVYWRDRQLCGVCKAKVSWIEAEIHHLKAYSKGGSTTLDNAQLVHRHCHPSAASLCSAATK